MLQLKTLLSVYRILFYSFGCHRSIISVFDDHIIPFFVKMEHIIWNIYVASIHCMIYGAFMLLYKTGASVVCRRIEVIFVEDIESYDS